MTWTYSASTDTWTKTPAGREVHFAPLPLPNPGEASLRSATIAHELQIVIRPDADGRTCYEVAIDGADLVIRKRVYGATLDPIASTPHYITIGQAFTLRARVVDTLIKGAVVLENGQEIEIEADVEDRATRTAWGFASEVDGATAAIAGSQDLAEVVSTVSEVHWLLAGGIFFACYDGVTLERFNGAPSFPASAKVQGTQLDGKVYLVGGGFAREADIVLRTISPMVMEAGQLPGQTADGTTTATLIASNLGALVFAGIPETPAAVYGTPPGEPLNLDLADLAVGGAWVRGVGDSAEIGEPIVCIARGTDNSLLLACTNSVNWMVGNPYEGTDRIITRSNTYGASGPNAAIQVAVNGADAILMHGPQGTFLLTPGGAPIPISLNVLTSYLTFPPTDRDRVRVTLARDPARQLLHIFVARDDDEASECVFVTYSETIGGYAPGGYGYFPITLPIVPTCACLWRGKLVLGTRDGRVVAFDDAAARDLATSRVRTRLSAHTLYAGLVETDTILRRVAFTLHRSSATATVRIFGGTTPQRAYEEPVYLAGPRDVGPWAWMWPVTTRSPAMVMRFESEDDLSFIIEQVDIEAELARASVRTGVKPAAPGRACRPVAIPAAPPTPDAAPGGGGPGSLPDGNPDPDTEPQTEAMQMPYPVVDDERFWMPFDEPFHNYFATDVDLFNTDRNDWFGDDNKTDEHFWVLQYGLPIPGGETTWGGYFDPSRFDHGAPRFGFGGGLTKYDYLGPGYFIPLSTGVKGAWITEGGLPVPI